jgi:hypothetical protein
MRTKYKKIFQYFLNADMTTLVTKTNQKAITKSSVGQHRPLTNAKVGSGAAKE